MGEQTANLLQPRSGRRFFGTVRWRGERITSIEESGPPREGEPWLIPGFVDAHLHVESSLLPPAELGRIAARHGTVAAVADPHEIANVLGADGVRFMLESARRGPLVFAFGASPCVPATPFETAGARLDADDLDALFDEPEVCFLAEVMNWPGVLAGDAGVLEKIERARARGYPIDGHAPGLTGARSARYAAAGITTDHECSTLEEARDKIEAGMFVQLREGSAARNLDALLPLFAERPDRLMLCSDDKHPDDLARGHIDRLCARAADAGHDALDIVRAATLNPVDHYGLEVGLLESGETMEAALVDDLVSFKPRATWIRGALVAELGESRVPHRLEPTPNRFAARSVDEDELRAVPGPVVEVQDGELLTGAGGRGSLSPSDDVLLLANVNRYDGAAPPAVALVRGFGLREGALASSVAHDSHNVLAVGATEADLARAINAVCAQRGGLAVATADDVELLPLPIAGLMSALDGDEVARRYAALDARARALGSTLRAPFMTLSFLALLVIPSLKLSDRGLFDGERFKLLR
jgi:adenine deaminase